MCDVVYALHVQQLEREVQVTQLMAATLAAAGAKDVQLPDLIEARADFDRRLAAAPARPGNWEARWPELDLRPVTEADVAARRNRAGGRDLSTGELAVRRVLGVGVGDSGKA